MASNHVGSAILGGRGLPTSPLSSSMILSRGTQEDDSPEGLFQTILGIPRELLIQTAQDVGGAANVGMATVGEFYELIGGAAPITFEDLQQKDWKGLGMVLAMGAGGWLGSASRGLPALRSLASGGALGKASSLALSESAAGAAFGLLAPLDEGESRTQALVSNAALGGLFGAGASFAKRGLDATVLGWWKNIRGAQGRAALGTILQKEAQTKVAREILGKELRNPSDPSKIGGVFRDSTGEKSYFVRLTKDGSRTQTFSGPDHFEQAGVAALSEGFTDETGFLGVERFKTALTEESVVPEAVVRSLGELPEELASTLDTTLTSIDFKETLMTRGALKALADEADANTFLAYEALTEQVNYLGTPRFEGSTRESILRQLAGSKKQKAFWRNEATDADLLKETIRQGLIDPEALGGAAKARDTIRELLYNRALPEGVQSIHINPVTDSVFSSLLTPALVGKVHPAFEPIRKMAMQSETVARNNDREFQTWFADIADRFNWLHEKKNSDIVKGFIDESPEAAWRKMLGPDATPSFELSREEQKAALKAAGFSYEDWVSTSRESAKRAANSASLPDGPDFGAAVSEIVDKMDEFASRLVEAGRLQEPLPGYFPIMNVGSWRVTLRRKGSNKVVSDRFGGFYNTRKEAAEALDKMIREAPNPDDLLGVISPKTFTSTVDSATVFDPQQFSMFIRGIMKTAKVNVDVAKELARREGARVVSSTTAPRMTRGFLKERRLGLRDFEDLDALQILEAYGRDAERTVAFGTFERDSKELMKRFATEQPRLREYTESFIDRMLGRPTKTDKIVDGIVESLGIEVAPGVLGRVSSVLRSWESMSKLGGLSSGIVNLTQIANTMVHVGPRWTVAGLRGLTDPKLRRETIALMRKYDAAPGIFTPLSRAGEIGGAGIDIGEQGILATEEIMEPLRALFRPTLSKGKRAEAGFTAATNTMLFAFNSAERLLRVSAFRAGFMRSKALNPGLGEEGWARAGVEALKTTQFDYSKANTPLVLQGPVKSVLFQFKSFFVNQIEFLSTIADDPKKVMGMAAAMSSLGGLSIFFNLPGTGMVSAATKLFTDIEIEEGLKLAGAHETGLESENLPDWDTLKKLAVYGAPGLLGVDASDYVGVGSLRDVTRGILGPAVQDMRNTARFIPQAAADLFSFGFVTEETMAAGVQATLPQAFKRILAGYDILQTGDVRNRYSRKSLYKADDRLASALRFGVGFPEIRYQQERIMDGVVTRRREKWQRGRTALAREAARSRLDNDPEGYSRAVERARSLGMDIEGRTVNYWLKELRRTGAERRRRRTPSDLRDEMMGYFEANGPVNGQEFLQERSGLPPMLSNLVFQ